MSAVPFSGSPGPDATASAPGEAAHAQRQLEQLLKQGRAHLLDLRSRLQQTADDRDRLRAELADSANAHQHEVDQLMRQMEDLRSEQSTLTRLLDEAASIQRELTEEVHEQRQQIHMLREAAMRAQAFAREIMRAHDVTQTPLSKTTK